MSKRRKPPRVPALRPQSWDGTPAVVCDKIGCSKPPILQADLYPAVQGEVHAIEAALCVDHLGELPEMARAALVIARLIDPKDELEERMIAVVAEHLP